MSRSPIVVRDAYPDDAAALMQVWADLIPRVTERALKPTLADAHAAISRTFEDVSNRTLVAEQDGEIVGAVHLARVPLSPIHLEEMVVVTHLYVAESARRHGTGKVLMAAGVSWAEEVSATTVSVMAQAQDRESNRYLARLGLGAIATVRVSTVSALRAGALPVETPSWGRADMRLSRAVSFVVAQRRAQRRAQAPTL